MQRNTLLIIAAGVIAILLVFLILVLGGEDGSRSADEDFMGSQDDPTQFTPDEGKGEGESAFNIPPTDPVERLERYRRWAVYPPFSRPLHAGQVDLIDPYNAERPPLGVVKTPAQDCQRTADGGLECARQPEMSDVICDLESEASISVGRDDFRVFFNCTNPKGEQLTPPQIEAKVYRVLFGKQYGSLPPVFVGDDGENGDVTAKDGITTIVVRPTAQDWGQMYVEVDAKVGDLEHNQRVGWFSTPHTVAEFAGKPSESIRDGNLVVSVPVNVQKKGYYEFQANLQEQGGEQRWIASATWEGDLPAGNAVVEFTFWGKIIRDAEADGPYVVREIRGKRHNSPVSPSMVEKSRREGTPIPEVQHTEPIWEFVKPYGEVYETQAYTASQFSEAEWDSEEKRQRLQFLEAQVQ